MDSSSSSSPSTSAPPPTSTSPLKRPESLLPPPLHQTDADEDNENVKQLKQCVIFGSAALSSVPLSCLELEDCLNSNRDWRSCQSEAQRLRACHEKQMNKGKSK